jgi:flagellar protein FliT
MMMTISDSSVRDNAIMNYYESIGYITSLMLRAAQDQDWETLVDAESCCAQLIRELEAAGDEKTRLAPGQSQRKQAIIRKMLANDAEIRILTQPWLYQLERMLGNAGGQRQLGTAYMT